MPALDIYTYNDEREFFDLLISKGANINIYENFSLLHYAVYNQSYKSVEYLLEKGININTLSTVYFDDCGRDVTALELNKYLDKAVSTPIDIGKKLNINRILLVKRSNPARNIRDIICKEDQQEPE